MSKQYPGGLITKTPVVPSGAYENSSAPGIWTLEQQAYWQKLGNWPTAGNLEPTTDLQFNYVTMLLHGNGTNGAQNNTFLDSSSNTRSITRTGTPTQGSFSPYGDNWSNFFPNASPATSYLVSGSYTLSGDFTVEGYVNWNGEGPNPAMFTFGDSSLATGFEVYRSGSTWLLFASNGVRVTGSAAVIGQWTYIAVTRSGTTVTLYINGVSQGTWTSSQTFSGTIKVGAEFYSGVYYSSMSGYISNFRVNNTTAINTVPTAPLTAVSGTIFLTCQSNRFVETSSNSTLTVTGTPSVQRFNPFGTATAYSTSVIGGSGYFNTGNYLGVSTLGSASSGVPYCIEMWVYVTSFRGAGEMRLCGAGTNDPLLQFSGSSELQFFVANSLVTSYSAAFKTNQWYHIAVTRNGANSAVMYLNGVSVSTATSSATLNTSSFLVGAQSTAPTIGLIGYMTDFRAVLGSVVYSSNFTPPTSPLTDITNTSLLCNFTNGAIFDNAMMNDLETAGSAQISTSVVKYGTGSIYFNGTTSYLTTLGQPIFSFGTGDFTIECWLNIISFNGGVVIDFRPSGVNGDYITVYFNSSSLEFYSGSSGRITSGTLTTATWFHFALCRSGSSTKMFIDGTQSGSTYTASVNYIVGTLLGIGTSTFALGSSFLDGYIDEFRITKGYARYTANFTPPTQAFFNTGPV